MKLTFLGTGAAGWSSATACKADERGIDRRCTSLLVDDDILIDPNGFVPEALETYGIDKRKIRFVFVSHSHGDHYNADTLLHIASDHEITVFGDDGWKQKLPESANIRFIPVFCNEQKNTPFGDVTAVQSTHVVEDTNEQCIHLIIRKDGRTLFYGPDGGWFTGGAWYTMEHFCFDAVILDATFSDDPSRERFNSHHIWFYHNSVTMTGLIRRAMIDKKMAGYKTPFFADHLSGGSFPTQEDARIAFGPQGLIPAYDGMTAEI